MFNKQIAPVYHWIHILMTIGLLGSAYYSGTLVIRLAEWNRDLQERIEIQEQRIEVLERRVRAETANMSPETSVQQQDSRARIPQAFP